MDEGLKSLTTCQIGNNVQFSCGYLWQNFVYDCIDLNNESYQILNHQL